MTHNHEWGGWFASFIRFGYLGNTRKCRTCGSVERRHLSGCRGADAERHERIIARLNASLERNGKRYLQS